MKSKEELRASAKRFNKIVIWGLRKKFHTHRYIFLGYYKTLKKIGIPVVWVEDEIKNQGIIEKNDLIISAEVQGKMVPAKLKFEDYHLPIRDDVYYCLHNFQNIFVDRINPGKLLKLQIYVKDSEKYRKIHEAVNFDEQTKTLFQPWGTDLLPEEFKSPVFNKSKNVFWIGSIWNNALNQGNIEAMDALKNALSERNLKFIPLRFIPDFLNILLIRHSRLAPAIAGSFQVGINYPPCRMFKNISYGQLGFSNVKKFDDILGEYNITGTIEEMVDKILSLSEREYKDFVCNQQIIVKNYTYLQHLGNIFKLL